MATAATGSSVAAKLLFASTVAAGLLSSGASAQSQPITYPQDSIDISQGSVCRSATFAGSPNTEERRAQMLVPASWLPPTGATITGVAFRSNGGGTVVHDALRIALSHHTTTNLDIAFACNLRAPQQVRQSTNLPSPRHRAWRCAPTTDTDHPPTSCTPSEVAMEPWLMPGISDAAWKKDVTPIHTAAL